MKRILFIVQLPPPVHGVSVMNLYAVKNPLLNNRYKLKVLPLYFGQKLNDIGEVNLRKLLYLAGFIIKLIFTMILFRPHLVYFTLMPTGKVFYRDSLITRIIKLFKSKILIHLHGKGIKEAVEKKSSIKRLYRETFNGVNLICLSNSLKTDISSVYDHEPFILPNGIEEQIINTELTVNDVPVLIFLSNLVINKGIVVFLKSLVELNKQNIPFRAKIVGASYDFSIEQAIKFCNINGLSDKVEVKGPKFGKEKIAELLHGDIFVLPSFNECFPLTILEAMQVGLPIVSTNVGGIPDLITNGKDGLLVRINDSIDLFEKLKLLLTDYDLRKKLGRSAKEKYYSQYTINHFNIGLAKIVEKVINP